jgi:hypothetical protein
VCVCVRVCVCVCMCGCVCGCVLCVCGSRGGVGGHMRNVETDGLQRAREEEDEEEEEMGIAHGSGLHRTV